MDFTLTIGWWAIPAFITIAALYGAFREQPAPSGNDYGAGAVIGLIFVMGAVIVSLVAWLVWAIFA